MFLQLRCLSVKPRRVPFRTLPLVQPCVRFLKVTPSIGYDPNVLYPPKEYNGPLSKTFRRLKIFSASSLALSTILAPFLLIVESNLPTPARLALASIAVCTSGVSTGLVGWCGRPYVNSLRFFQTGHEGSIEGIEMTTSTLLLNPRITRVYDPHFLIKSTRPFSKWELAQSLVLPSGKSGEPGLTETVAETMDKRGEIIGRWIVKWEKGGKGTCSQVGRVIRHFNVHEELLRR